MKIRKVANIPKSSGVYRIVNIVNGHCYIGQSKDLHARAVDHFCLLDHGKHYNPYLQNAYNKYGRGSFVFDVLETPVKWGHLDDREQYFIELLKPTYNIIRNVYEGLRCALNDKETHDSELQLMTYGESIKPIGWADANRPHWHRAVYGGGSSS